MSRLSPATLPDLYRQAATAFSGIPAFATKGANKQFHAVTFDALYAQGMALATALIERGLQPRQNVALYSDNRFEWILCDYGIQLAGGADVPRGADITESEISYITRHSESAFVFVENLRLLEKYRNAAGEMEHVRHVILMDPAETPPEGVLALKDLVEKGEALRKAGDRRVEDISDKVEPDDYFTIIYTSGTTGTPKGVPLTHRNICSQIRNLPFGLRKGDRALSILPIWHSYERVFEMVCIAHGATTYYTNIRSIGEDLQLVKPTVMASAPRLWENLYLKILDRVNSGSFLKRSLFQIAYRSARATHRARLYFQGKELDIEGHHFWDRVRRGVAHGISAALASIPHRLLDGLVLKKLRQVVGGEFRGTISGGGALPPHVDEFFNFIGIPVLEGYGLTETSPVLAVRTWDNLVIGTVGAMFPETEVRICDLNSGEILHCSVSAKDRGRGLKGEVVVRGPQVMNGYYKDPERTQQVLADNWFRTGDIGMITFNNCLRILGRCKDTIVLLNGENVEPQPIESKLCESPLVHQCMVVGQDQKTLGALIVPNKEAFDSAGFPAETAAELEKNSEARALMDREIRRLISTENGFKAFERIATWRFIEKPFEVGDELTPTFKIKRHVITDKYADQIGAIFS